MTKSVSLSFLLMCFLVIYPLSSPATAANYIEKPFENPGADAPALELPTDVMQRAQAVIDASSLTGAIDAVEAVLAQGGVAVKNNKTLLNHPLRPFASAYVEAVNLADLTLDAQNRTTAAALTAQQLADMLADFGWPSKTGKTPVDSLILFLKTWLQAALKNPDDPSHFAILFIAANNQLQAPRANLLWAYQSPELIRFSRLELELLSAAFDRALTTSASTKTIAGACAPVSRQFGKWNDSAAVSAGQLADSALSRALAALYGPSVGGFNPKTKAALDALGLAAKTFKFTQSLRYGALSARAEGADVITKPFLGQPAKIGKLSAQVGVDPATYADYQTWVKQSSAQALANNNACLDYLGLPRTTLTDSVTNAKNWRVNWSVGAGFDQVHWQLLPQTLEMAKPLTAHNATEASSTANYVVEKQTSKTASPDTRERTAVFTAKLAPANDATLWGQGLAGFTAASANNSGYQRFAGLMGLAGTGNSQAAIPLLASSGMVSLVPDTVGQWALEVISPKRKVKKKLKENKPKHWAGTIEIAYSYKYLQLHNTKDAAQQTDESDSIENSELTIFNVDQKDPFSGGDMTFAETACASLAIYSNKEKARDWEGLGWSRINEHKRTFTNNITSGRINAATEFRVYDAYSIGLILISITDPKERAYWLKKVDTWDLYAFSPTCNGKNKRTQTYYESVLDYDTISQTWKHIEGSPSLNVYHSDVYSHINSDIAGTPVLSGKLVNGEIPSVIDQAAVIKRDDHDSPSKKLSWHELHTVSVHLHQVE